ncbi:hypothetical protein BGZ72_006094, partial [Mortierella alpina]
MKYGNYLKERRSQLPEEWQQVFIDYEGLKTFIKEHIAPACLKPSLTNQQSFASSTPLPAGSGQGNTPSTPFQSSSPAILRGSALPGAAHEDLNEFSATIASRLTILQNKVPEFLAQLDQQVGDVSTFTTLQTRRIYEAYGEFQGGRVGLGVVSEDENNESTDTSGSTLETLLQSVIKLEKYIFLNYTGIVKIIKKMDRHAGLAISEAYLGHVWKLPFARAEQLSSLKKELMEKLSGVLTKINTSTQHESSIGRS